MNSIVTHLLEDTPATAAVTAEPIPETVSRYASMLAVARISIIDAEEFADSARIFHKFFILKSLYMNRPTIRLYTHAMTAASVGDTKPP